MGNETGVALQHDFIKKDSRLANMNNTKGQAENFEDCTVPLIGGQS